MKKTKPLAKRSEALFPTWQRSMNPEQLAAIVHEEGPARLLAAAGSGKTRVVTHRIARLVEKGVNPARILALTFSKKAADEMSNRVDALDVRGARVGTWHSLCLQILKQDRTRWSNWEIRESTKLELKDVLGWKGMDWKGADTNRISSFIGRCKANLFDPGSPGAAELAKTLFGWESKRVLEAFHHYNEKLAEKEILSFDDFLVFAAEHLADEDNRANWASKYDHVIQDEAQDENQAQRHIAHLLAKDHRNYMVVGDVFQAIYGFRGSTPEYLAKFEEEWPGAVTYWLPRNYRSGRAIVAAANGIVRKAKVEGIEPQDMVADRTDEGSVHTLTSETLDDEATNFVAWLTGKVRCGEATYSDVTALFRTNAQSRSLEEALLGARIPYVVVGGTSFYERREVRDLLAYLRVACRRGEVEDIKRCINSPFRFLGAKFVERIQNASANLIGAEGGVQWSDVVLKVADGEGIQRRQRESAQEWADMVETVARRIADGEKPGAKGRELEESMPEAILGDIVRLTKYLDWIKKEEGEESIETSGAANVREMIRVSGRFTTCDALLDYIDETIRASRRQREDKQAGGDRVLLMNVHRSKGLEWPHVWIAGFNEMIMPHVRGDQEEERRLAYVATTRARDSLVLSCVRRFTTRDALKDAQPSRFLADTGVRLDAPPPLGDESKIATSTVPAAGVDAGTADPALN